LFYWLDLLRDQGLSYERWRTTGANNPEEVDVGRIKNVCKVSADSCYQLETAAMETGGFDPKLTSSPKPSGADDLFIATSNQAPIARHRPKKLARRNERYTKIDIALRRIAESNPQTQEEVFTALEGRVLFPPAEPFLTADGWLAGFRRDGVAARAWLSKRWGELELPPLPRGPKKYLQ
jgi:hypothetical protein